MKSECKGCTERFVGCHVTCQKYIDWKAEKDARNRIIREAKIKEDRLIDAEIRAHERMRDKKKGRRI